MLSKFLTKNRKVQVAVHLDSEQINIAVAQIEEEQQTIQCLAQMPLDKNQLASFVKENKLTNLPTYLVIGGKQIVSRVITMPEIPKKELTAALSWEVTKYIPIPVENLVFDYEIIEKVEGSTGNQLRIMVIASRKDYVEEYCDLIAQAGLKPKIVDVEGSVLKYFYLNLQQYKPEVNTCCIYLDNSQGVFTFIARNNIFFIHNVEWSQEITTRLVAEYQRVSTYLQRQLQLETVNNVILFGPQATEANMEYLKNELDLEIAIADLQTQIIKLAEHVEKIDPIYTFALGLLLREVD